MHVSNHKQDWESELFRLFVESSSDYAIFVVDLKGRVLTWNHGAERVLGYSDNDIINQPASILFTPEDCAAGVPEAELDTAARDGRASDDRWHMRKDGSRLWVSGVMTLLRDKDGKATAYAKIMRDVTEGKLTADALRESESRLRVAMEAAEMGTWLWRIPTDEQILDDSLRRLMGLTEQDAVLTLDGFLRAVHPEDADRVRAEFDRCVYQGGGFNVEFRVHWADGSLHWLRDQGKVFYDERGTPHFMTGACVDITGRKQDEEELLHADRQKDEFLALLAHELRNPLAPLRNGLQMMRFVKEPEQIAETRAMMERQLGHMVRLIDDLLDISRLSQHKLHLQIAPILLAETVAHSIESARPIIEAAGQELTMTLPSEPILVDADLTRLSQVFANLLINSAKYTQKGGSISLSAHRNGQEVVVAVKDNGIGIPSDALPDIFDMFSQVDRSIERATGGLGIGLALVKGLTEMHGGHVSVASEGVGRGSTFSVTIPISAQSAQFMPQLRTENEVEIANEGLRILVVDDNRDSAISLAALLRILGNETQTAHDGVEAVSLAEEFQPKLILMDVGMPKLNGYAATEQIRRQPWGKNICIIALTGWGQDGDKERSQNAACDGHLVKPVALSDLTKLLKELRAHG